LETERLKCTALDSTDYLEVMLAPSGK